mmetsp:Transcript_34131/g.98415  ORF Transcript_34131/g.98415 Transcript_34131/m.98415 type:complete len:220 (+) Transcript_34131:111-770(+)
MACLFHSATVPSESAIVAAPPAEATLETSAPLARRFRKQLSGESMASTTCSSGHPILVVRNTFIEAGWLSDEEESPASTSLVRSSSCPLLWSATETTCTTPSGSVGDSVEFSLVSMAPELVDDTPLKPHVAPLHCRQPEHSIGSAAHFAGACKPCAWFWRPQGCDNGFECRHCHLCPAGELKSRKRSKQSGTRRRRGGVSGGGARVGAGPTANGRRFSK